jgi:hypothetical protein
MTAIEASSVRVKTLVDGTLRAELDFEPRNAAAAFALLGQPGQAVAVAALRVAPAPAPAAETRTTGPLSRLAGQWCRMPAFLSWSGAANAEEAAEFIRRECGIGSRAELDAKPTAAALFHANIREPFAEYLRSNV